MFSEHTQRQQSHLNGNIYATLDGYSTIARRNVEMQNVHAHVHEFNAITPKNSIDADKEAQVHVRWSMYGDLTPFITGTWHVNAFLESLEIGNNQRISLTPGTMISLTPQTGPVDYEAWVRIPANTVSFTEDECSKPYKLVITVTYNAPVMQPGLQTIGVAGPAFQSQVALVTPLTYREPTGFPDPQTDSVDGPELQFYIVA